MTAAEMRSLVESLGLTRRDVTGLLKVGVSTVARWWNGQVRIPVGVSDEVFAWVDVSDDLESQIAEQLRATGTGRTYLTDEDLASSTVPETRARFGVVFHRVAAARALVAFNEHTDGEPGRLQWADEQGD